MPETIFRRMEEPAEDFLSESVEAVVNVNSADSSNTGMHSSVSDRTTITVHRVQKLRPEDVSDPVSEETPLTTDVQPNQDPVKVKDIDAAPRSNDSSRSSSSDRTAMTNPVTPDTSIDGGFDLIPSQQNKSEASKANESRGDFRPSDDDDTREGVTSEKLGRYEGDRSSTKDYGHISVDSPHSANTEKEPTSGKRSSVNSNSQNERGRAARRSHKSKVSSRHTRYDESSSDDDSSYFATHLPSPKSGRSFSISSSASNASAFSSQYQIQKQGSDASLSFSDESDEDHHHHHNGDVKNKIDSGVHLAPVVNPNRAVVDMSLYPQRITRMHSVSSLLSSASSDNRIADDSEDEGPNRRRSFTGDDSVTSSLPSIASTGPEAMHRSLDSNAPDGGYYVHSSGLLQQLHHNYHSQPYTPQQTAGMPHFPQQPLTNQQMMAWATPPSDGEFAYSSSEYTNSSQQKQLPFGQGPQTLSPVVPQSSTYKTSGSGNALKSSSSGSLNFMYSDDDDLGGRGKGQSLFSSAPKGKQAANSGTSGGRNSRGGDEIGPGQTPEMSGLSTGDLGRGSQRTRSPEAESAAVGTGSADKGLVAAPGGGGSGRQTFKVYWQRWIMLFYMSVLNLLSDWTCYSVAPISLLTEEAFGSIDPERLVVVFLGANALATACEPMILARLGLRRTVLLGSFLLTIGSIVKSGGLPPFMQPDLEVGHAEWSLYIGFFIVGLSQPLYQCTPALLSASWFPEEERTMATGVALNANQLGIGFAFIFGTLLVSKADDIIPYFGLLSQISTLAFIGTLLQFDDAPPTPPSSSARVMRGNLNFKMPNFADTQIKRYFTTNREVDKKSKAQAPTPASSSNEQHEKSKPKRTSSSSSKGKKPSRSSTRNKQRSGSSTRRRNTSPKLQTANSENGLSAPSSAHYGSTSDAMKHIADTKAEVESLTLIPHAQAPSPAMPGGDFEGDLGSPNRDDSNDEAAAAGLNASTGQMPMPMPMGPGGPQGAYPPGQMPGYYGYGYPPPPPPPDFQYFQQQMQQQAYYQQQMYHQQQMQQAPLMGGPPAMMPGQGVPPGMAPGMPPPPQQMPYFAPPQQMPQQMAMPYSYQQQYYQSPYGAIDYRSDAYDIDAYGDEGAEPTVTVTNHHLDIEIRDDQVVRSLHACMMRQGFSHALAAFTVSGIVINTLSTYMDYLVRLNGSPRSYTGIVGGGFQFLIMMSSLVMGKQTDKTRAYYSVTTGMLVLGAFGLAECGVSLDSNRGGDLRWSLLLVAVLVGPLQPISTELGVEVAYPLSENTVLVIQQLFSNLLSAIFIPFFKSLKDIGTTVVRNGEIIERPQFTFSFYLLIVLHTLVTVYFATFNGRYLRYEHELQKKEEEAAEDDAEIARQLGGEYAPLMHANATR